MAHAYETFASGGNLIYGSLSPGADNGRGDPAPGPVGITRITRGKGDPIKLPNGERAVNRVRQRRVLDEAVAEQVGSLLQGVVQSGTGTRAQVADTVIAGKTGTTEGYGDAWFVGWTPKYTVAVWVGYPNEFKSMKTEFQGQPVAGGTFPAGIFKTFAEALNDIDPPKEEEDDDLPEQVPTTPATPGTEAPTSPTPAPTTPAPTGGTGGTEPEPEQAEPAEPAPAEPAPAEPAPPAEQPPAEPPPGPTGGETAPPPGD